MRIDILTFDGCPNAGPTRALVREAVRLEAVLAEMHFIDVPNLDLAERLRFLGSPSVRVDGEDIEPSAKHQTEYGLMCRTYSYGTDATGTPTIAMIRAAIRRHIEA